MQTRLKKLEDGVVDATLLAMAGLRRLGLADRAIAALETEEMLPAVAQGAIGITARTGDEATLARLAPLDHPVSHIRVTAERAFLAVLDGSCRTPIAGLAELDGSTLKFRGLMVKPDGSICLETSLTGDASDAAKIGQTAAEELRGRSGPDFFAFQTPDQQ